jgi:hypothetical protein
MDPPLLKQIYGLSDEGVCERWVYDPYFQFFTGKEFFNAAGLTPCCITPIAAASIRASSSSD